MNNTQPMNPAQSPQGLATGSLITGILALVLLIVLFFWLGGMMPLALGAILGVTAVVLGTLALKRGQARAFAITGIVAGALAIALGVGLLAFALIFVGALAL